MRPKPTVGQQLFSLNIGNAARNTPQKLTPVIVTKVGRKYFQVSSLGQYEREYNIEDWSEHSKYSPNSKLYVTEQEWLDEQEADKISHRIYNAFEYGHNRLNISIENMRKIADLIPTQPQ